MSDVMHWLFNDGASSRLGGGGAAAALDSMSLGSLQASSTVASRVCCPFAD